MRFACTKYWQKIALARPDFLCWILFIIAWFPGGAGLGASPPSPDVATLQRAAAAKDLASNPEWRRLLFIVPGWFHSTTSIVDSPDFFFAPQGKSDPGAELDATLQAFFDPQALTKGLRQVHPLCAFPARKRWLQKALGIPDSAFPVVSCPTLDEWRSQRKYGAASMVFSSFYPDNPASMFGHVFLRLHRQVADGAIGSHLNDDAVNYAALADTTNPLAYTWRGVMGGFVGRFALAPYYMKLQEYNNLESRDLWEYRLELSPEEIDRMLLSLWEIGAYDIDYYYFDDNCSFILLALLETASPRIHLTEKLRFWVTPSDSLRVAVDNLGTPGQAAFRPSALARYLERHGSLAGEDRVTLLQLFDPETEMAARSLMDKLAPPRRQAVLDAGLDFVDFQEKLGGDKSAKRFAATRQWMIASRRDIKEPPLPYRAVPAQRDPMAAHRTSRVELGGGKFFGRSEISLIVTPALHDLLSDAKGYGPGMEIIFMQLHLQGNPKSRDVYVKALNWIEVRSLAVDQGGLRPWSWTFSLFSERDEACSADKDVCYRHALRGGPGKTFAISSNASLFLFALPEAGYMSGSLHAPYLGFGALGGVLWEPLASWRVLADTSWSVRHTLREREAEANGRVQSAFQLGARSEVRLSYTRHLKGDEEIAAGYSLFF